MGWGAHGDPVFRNLHGFYDALIVAAAVDAGCEVLCSEDLQDGQKFAAVTVENPFPR
jgi:predicted nucleic acid-binding protein